MTVNLDKNRKYTVALRCGGKLGPVYFSPDGLGLFVLDHPIHSAAWIPDGRYTCQYGHPFDIISAEEIIEPKVVEGWINIYTHLTAGQIYETKARADANATFGRIACTRVRYTEGEGLTPTEGEASHEHA